MSSLLKTSRLIRCFTVYRNVNIRSRKFPYLGERFATSGIIRNPHANYIRPHVDTLKSYKEGGSIERLLHSLDYDIRQKGRISLKDLKDVVFVIKSTGQISSSQGLLLIRCCGNLIVDGTPQKRTELVAEIMSSLKELNIKLDISHYNALLRVYLDNRTEYSPFEFLENLEKNNIMPNRFTFTYLVASFCVNGDIEGATKMLEVMKEKGIPIDESVINYLIIGHAEANDMESADAMIEFMKEKGIKPTSATYASLLYGYAKFGDITRIRDILHFCEQNRMNLANIHYMDIIYSLTVNGHSEHVDEIIDKVKDSIKYSQDVINLAYRLLNKEHDEVAIKVIKSLSSVEHHPQYKNGVFIIHYLLEHNQPITRIVRIVKMLRDEGINEVAFITALREMLVQEKKEEAIYLLKKLNEDKVEIRPHYFYPLFCQAGRNKDNKQIIELVKLMRYLNVPRGRTIVRNFIMPNYQIKDVIQDFELLCSAGIRPVLLAKALFAEYAEKGDLKSCEILATNFYISFHKNSIIEVVRALARTGDVNTFVNINAHLFDCYLMENKLINDDAFTEVDDESFDDFNPKRGKRENSSESFEEPESRYKEFGEFVIRQMANSPQAAKYLKPVVEGFLENGIGIRQSAVEQLSKILGNAVSKELLEKLASQDLKPKPVVKSTSFEEQFPAVKVTKPTSRVDFSELDKEFTYLVNARLFDQAEEMFEKLKADNALNVFRYNIMLKLQCVNGNYKKAVEIGDEMKSKFPDEIKTDFLTLYYVEALMHVKRFDEAFSIFESINPLSKVPENLFLLMTERYIEKTGDLHNARKLFEIGVEKNIFHPNQFSLLTNEYLKRKDYESAVDVFSMVAEKYKWLISSRNTILRDVISTGNAQLIEKVKSVVVKLRGETDFTLGLVAAYAELNNEKEIKKLLENSSVIFKDKKMKVICDHLINGGNDTAIACIIKASKGTKSIDRRILYDYQLECLKKNDNPTKALNLWLQMQEEDVVPSQEFLNKLSNFLQEKKLETPFVVKKEDKGKLLTETGLSEAIEEKNFDKFCEVLNYLIRTKQRIPFAAVSSYIRNEMVSKGDVDKLKTVRLIIPTLKGPTTWEAMTLIAHTVIGKRKEYLLELVEKLKMRKQIDPLTKIPFRFLLGMILEDANLIKELREVEEIAKEYNMKVYSSVLWAYYILNKDLKAAKNYEPQNLSQTLALIVDNIYIKRFNDVLESLLDVKDDIRLTDKEIVEIYNIILTRLKLRDDVEKMQYFYNRAVRDKKGHLISEDLVRFMRTRNRNFEKGKITR